jgi:hypothetical protein
VCTVIRIDDLAENARRFGAECHNIADEHYAHAFRNKLTSEGNALFVGTGLDMQGVGVGTHVV